MTSSAPSVVTITTTNSAPVANAGANQTVPVTATAQLDGSGSTDVDGDPLTYAWSFVTRPAGSQTTLTGANTVAPSFAMGRLSTRRLGSDTSSCSTRTPRSSPAWRSP